MAADILKGLEDEAFAAERMGYDKGATVFRAAIAELRSLRTALTGRTVSCEACNAAAKRIEVLERECMASRVFDKHQAKPIHRDNYGSMIDAQTRLLAARRATDENGGLGA